MRNKRQDETPSVLLTPQEERAIYQAVHATAEDYFQRDVFCADPVLSVVNVILQRRTTNGDAPALPDTAPKITYKKIHSGPKGPRTPPKPAGPKKRLGRAPAEWVDDALCLLRRDRWRARDLHEELERQHPQLTLGAVQSWLSRASRSGVLHRNRGEFLCEA